MGCAFLNVCDLLAVIALKSGRVFVISVCFYLTY